MSSNRIGSLTASTPVGRINSGRPPTRHRRRPRFPSAARKSHQCHSPQRTSGQQCSQKMNRQGRAREGPNQGWYRSLCTPHPSGEGQGQDGRRRRRTVRIAVAEIVMPKLQQLTADPDVAPPRVLPRQASDELHRLGMQSGPARPRRRYIHLRRTSSRCHPTSVRGLPGCGFLGVDTRHRPGQHAHREGVGRAHSAPRVRTARGVLGRKPHGRDPRDALPRQPCRPPRSGRRRRTRELRLVQRRPSVQRHAGLLQARHPARRALVAG